VVESRDDPLLLGYVTERDVLDAYYRAVEDGRREEYGD
jgi:CBS domain-containing protein